MRRFIIFIISFCLLSVAHAQDSTSKRLTISTHIQGDGAVFFGQNQDFDPIGNGMRLRRAEFVVKMKINNDWSAALGSDWANGKLGVKDVYLSYTGAKNFEVRAGNIKENFGIQRMASTNYLQFMELPMVTELTSTRLLGLMATYRRNLLWTSIGVFGPDISGEDELSAMDSNNQKFGHNEGLTYTGKVVLRPLYDKKEASLHIGGAFSYINPKTTDQNGWAVSRYSSRNSTIVNRKKYLDTDLMHGVDHEIRYTAEISGHYKGLRYEGAYIARAASFDQSINPIGVQKVDGWYIQAGYLLFGGNQNYDAKGAVFSRVSRGKSWGDVELCARYEYCNFNTKNYFGGCAEAYALGLNFYVNDNVKIVLNYQYNNNDKYANGRGEYFVGYDASGTPTKDPAQVVGEAGKVGVDYSMVALRFDVAF